MIRFDVLENHKVIGSFTVDGNTVTGTAPDLIQQYALAPEKKKGTVEVYALYQCGTVGNLLGLEESGYGIVKK